LISKYLPSSKYDRKSCRLVEHQFFLNFPLPKIARRSVHLLDNEQKMPTSDDKLVHISSQQQQKQQSKREKRERAQEAQNDEEK
jgi:hypothetical protein